MKNTKLAMAATIALAMSSPTSFAADYCNSYQLNPKPHGNKKRKNKRKLSKKARRDNR